MALRFSDDKKRRVLAILLFIAAFCQAGSTVSGIDQLRHGTKQARVPLLFGFRLETISGVMPEAKVAGIHNFDVLEEVDGLPFKGSLVLDEEVGRKQAGDSISVLVRRPDGTRDKTKIRLAPIREVPASTAAWIVTLAIQVLLPVLSLSLGFWVAFARPYDRLAWLLLALMIGFSQWVEGFSWPWPLMSVAIIWNALLGQAFGAWLIWLVLFGVYFPERAEFDKRHPWLKWVLLIPLILVAALFFAFALGSAYSFSVLYPLRPVLDFFIRVPIYTYLSFVAIGSFFTLIGLQGGRAKGDARRRLRILYVGTCASLAPLFVVAVISVIRGEDIFSGVPEWAKIITLLMLLLFPLTMAYVIVVQRAMAVGMVVRQGVRYALARRGLQFFRGGILGLAIWSMSKAFSGSHARNEDRIAAVVLLGIVIALRGRYSKKLALLIDRRFFREAYSAEILLSELAQETRRFTEAEPLLSTVTNRIASTLHISRIAVFQRENDRFCVTQTIGVQPNAVACLSPQGRSVGLLSEAKKAEVVYFDDLAVGCTAPRWKSSRSFVI